MLGKITTCFSSKNEACLNTTRFFHGLFYISFLFTPLASHIGGHVHTNIYEALLCYFTVIL